MADMAMDGGSGGARRVETGWMRQCWRFGSKGGGLCVNLSVERMRVDVDVMRKVCVQERAGISSRAEARDVLSSIVAPMGVRSMPQCREGEADREATAAWEKPRMVAANFDPRLWYSW